MKAIDVVICTVCAIGIIVLFVNSYGPYSRKLWRRVYAGQCLAAIMSNPAAKQGIKMADVLVDVDNMLTAVEEREKESK